MARFRLLLTLALATLQFCGTPRTTKSELFSHSQGGEFHEIQELPESVSKDVLRQCQKLIKNSERDQIHKFNSDDYSIFYSENATHYLIRFLLLSGSGPTGYDFFVAKTNALVDSWYSYWLCG